jgi:hypothetical protein
LINNWGNDMRPGKVSASVEEPLNLALRAGDLSRRGADVEKGLVSKEIQGNHTDIGIGRCWGNFYFEPAFALAKFHWCAIGQETS